MPTAATRRKRSRRPMTRVVSTRAASSCSSRTRDGGPRAWMRRSGPLAHHGDTLVTPLLLSDAPIVTWWPYEVPKDPAHDCIGAMSARRITDTTHCAHPDAALRTLRAVGRVGDAP